jgi:5-methylcytosine-specific restriction protein A
MLFIGDPDDTFNPGDHSAIEGDEYGIFIKAKKRDKKLAEERKIKDNYTCQACKLKLIINNHPIIECHHINPIEFGRRESTIDDLVCLCPTCHRVAHQKQPPYSVSEITKLVGKI